MKKTMSVSPTIDLPADQHEELQNCGFAVNSIGFMVENYQGDLKEIAGIGSALQVVAEKMLDILEKIKP